jgi:SAM-dependent methyltransferase
MIKQASRAVWNVATQNRRLLRRKQAQILANCGGRVIEIGSGNERNGRYFQSAVDLAPDGVDFTMTDVNGNHAHQLLDITAVGGSWGSYDVVLCCNVLEHVFDLDAALAGLVRLVADDGVVLVSTPFAYPLHDEPGDFWRPTEHALRNLFERHFDEVTIEHTGIRQFPFQLFVTARQPKRA